MSQGIRRLTVLISGSGTNLAAILNACNTPQLPNASVVRVISNRKNAYGITRAQELRIPTIYHNLVTYKKRFSDSVLEARSEYDKDLAELVKADNPDLVVCAGWMHVFSPSFLSPLSAAGIPIINLHPALPGQYNGVDAIKRAHDDWKNGKVNETGVMIHYVIEAIDEGKPLLVENIRFVEGQDDEIEHFEQRLHEVEWGAIVKGARLALEAKNEQQDDEQQDEEHDR